MPNKKKAIRKKRRSKAELAFGRDMFRNGIKFAKQEYRKVLPKLLLEAEKKGYERGRKELENCFDERKKILEENFERTFASFLTTNRHLREIVFTLDKVNPLDTVCLNIKEAKDIHDSACWDGHGNIRCMLERRIAEVVTRQCEFLEELIELSNIKEGQE